MATTQPGGSYIVGGRLVDANGKAIEEEASFDVSKANKAELEAEAARRGIEVKRADGDTEKDPTAEDFRAALK